METFFNLSRAQLAMIAAVEPYFITDDVQVSGTQTRDDGPTLAQHWVYVSCLLMSFINV